MPYPLISAAHVGKHAQRRSSSTAACSRCGRVRKTHGGSNRSGLCRDCVDVLTDEELAVWGGVGRGAVPLPQSDEADAA